MTFANQSHTIAFLTAARQQSQSMPNGSELAYRRHVQQEMLDTPFDHTDPYCGQQDVQARCEAAIEVALGEVFDALINLKETDGKKFKVERTSSAYKLVDAGWSGTARVRVAYGAPARDTVPDWKPDDLSSEVLIGVTFVNGQMQEFTMTDLTRQITSNGRLQYKFTSGDAQTLSKALGEAVAYMAPSRVSEIQQAIASNEAGHRMASIVASMTLRAPRASGH